MSEKIEFNPFIHSKLPKNEGGGFVDSDAIDTYVRARYDAAKGKRNQMQAMDSPEIKKKAINILHEEALKMDRKLKISIDDAKSSLETKNTFWDKHPHPETLTEIERREYHGDPDPWTPSVYPSHYIESIQTGGNPPFQRDKPSKSTFENEIGPLAQNEIYVKYFLKEDYPLAFASPELRANRKIVEFAVDVNGENIRYAADELRNDKELALRAIRQNGIAIMWIGQKLKHDKDIISTFKDLYHRDIPQIVFDTNVTHGEQK